MAGFVVDETPGKLVFENGYAIPNPAVCFEEEATLGLWMPVYVGEDREAYDSTIPYPRVQKGLTHDVGLRVSQHAASDGTPATTHVERVATLKANIAELAAVAEASETGNGEQDVEYTSTIGATPVTVPMVVGGLMLGSVERGSGVKVMLPLAVASGAVT